MALVEHVQYKLPDLVNGGDARLVLILENTQWELGEEGSQQFIVTRLRITNTTSKKAEGIWWTTGPAPTRHIVLPGENTEQNIPPSRRVAQNAYQLSLAWG